ncbi:hypothetical protein BKA70DRAFT_230436 [Coprinopsis sp. MPI-PUGE-AT-0042]|nr:hypothetical protein BKA70DRAFT_230436 [Coprinopsis sp. MPI-PUGE-AT-0042]
MHVTNAQVSAHFELEPDQLKLFQQSLRRLLKGHLNIDKPPGEQGKRMCKVQIEMAKEWPDKVNLADEVSTTILATFARQLVYNLRLRSRAPPRTKRRVAPRNKSHVLPEVLDIEDDGALAPTRRACPRTKANQRPQQQVNRNQARTSLQTPGPSRKAEGSRGPNISPVFKTEQIMNHPQEQALELSRGQGKQVVKEFLMGASPNLPLWLFDKFLEFGINTHAALQDLASKEEDAIGKVLDAMDKREKDERKKLPPYQRVLILDAFRKLPIDLS